MSECRELEQNQPVRFVFGFFFFTVIMQMMGHL